MKKLIPIFLIIASVTGCFSSENNNPQTFDPISKTEILFDTVVTISIHDSQDESLLNDVFEMYGEYEQVFSRTSETSEIFALNNANGEPFEVSDDVLELLLLSKEYYELSDGLFDVTIASISELWNFSESNPFIPSDEKINSLLPSVGFDNVLIDGNFVTLLNNAKIDLGGIAKGYVGDKASEFLKENGVEKGLINIGGNVIALGSKTEENGWQVGIKKPFGGENSLMLAAELSDKTVVTSGGYERGFYYNNELYHHILDPNTGYPAPSDLLSISIITDQSVIADILSTTCYILGFEKGMELINSLDNIEAIFIDENYGVHLSNNLENFSNITYLN